MNLLYKIHWNNFYFFYYYYEQLYYNNEVQQAFKNVCLNKMLSDGYFNEQKKFVKYSLEEAAKILEMPKSTLDNYFDQIKKARETNFDFNRHKDEPYSFLCVHNREKKD